MAGKGSQKLKTLKQYEYDELKLQLGEAYQDVFDEKLTINKDKLNTCYEKLCQKISEIIPGPDGYVSTGAIVDFFFPPKNKKIQLQFSLSKLTAYNTFISYAFANKPRRQTIHDRINKLVLDIRDALKENDNEGFIKYDAKHFSERLSQLLEEGGEIRDTLIKELHPLCDVCLGCGRGDDTYSFFRVPILKFVSENTTNSDQNEDMQLLFSQIAKAEYNFGNEKLSLFWANRASEKSKFLEQFEDTKTKLSIIKSLMVHDDDTLSWCKFNIEFRKGHFYPGHDQIASGYACQACIAVGKELPDADLYVAQFEEAIRNISDINEREKQNYWLKITRLAHLVNQYGKNKSKSLNVKIINILVEITNDPHFRNKEQNKISLGFVYAVLSQLSSNTKEGDYKKAQKIIGSVIKYNHCLFNLEKIRDYLNLPNPISKEKT